MSAVTSTRPETERPEKKVAIVGFTASKTLAPWGDPEWSIWVCNNLPLHCPDGWHRLYDLHETEEIVKDKQHEAFLRGIPQKAADGREVRLGERPVYCFEPQPEWPTAVQFPRDELTGGLGNYFTNSISWMIAHALREEVTHLSIYGVDMATGGEYAAQRPSCEYFLGIAVGAGVKVHIPEQSDLLKTAGLYGSGTDSALHAKMTERRTELTERLAQVRGQKEQMMIQEAQLMGALETTDYIIDVWTNTRARSRHEDKAETNGHGDPEQVKELVAA